MTTMKIAAIAALAAAMSVPAVQDTARRIGGTEDARTTASLDGASAAALAGSHGYQLARQEGGASRLD